MKVRLVRWLPVLAALTFFEGRLGLICAAAIALAYEAAGVPLRMLWAIAVGAIAIAPVAMIVQGIGWPAATGAGFARGNALATTLVAVGLAFAVAAICAEVTGAPGTAPAREPAVKTWFRTFTRLSRRALRRSARASPRRSPH
jgi:hypothetical protein